MTIFPSLLSAHLMYLASEVDQVIAAGASTLHLDVMDNHYVPNLTFGPNMCKALHQYAPTIPIDVHLMVNPVDALIEQFAASGASRISIHPDATQHLDRSLKLIRSKGCKVGLALNPATTTDILTWTHQELDFVLVMTVNPGFGGQTLIQEVIPKITKIHQQYPNLTICVDGGITKDNIANLAKAGASEFVVGSALFESEDYLKTMQMLSAACRS